MWEIIIWYVNGDVESITTKNYYVLPTGLLEFIDIDENSKTHIPLTSIFKFYTWFKKADKKEEVEDEDEKII